MARTIPASVDLLVQELKRLPGVGEKTATRYVLHLLQRNPEGPLALAGALKRVASAVSSCPVCGFLAEDGPCAFCRDESRDRSVVCVVEGVADTLAIEKVGEYNGLYHVLGGVVSALRGITPDKLSIGRLLQRVRSGGIREVILATSANAEGETTALYVRKVLEGTGVRVTRPATGIPMGSSIEYLDAVTLMRALRGRKDL